MCGFLRKIVRSGRFSQRKGPVERRSGSDRRVRQARGERSLSVVGGGNGVFFYRKETGPNKEPGYSVNTRLGKDRRSRKRGRRKAD